MKLMHIVILNWRDIKNPHSGGAELLTHEISKYLVKRGHKVTQFSAQFSGSKHKEIIDGVTIIREGNPDLRSGFSSVHFKAYSYYKHKKFGKVDFYIDEVHGVPFFTPIYIKEKKAALICERAGELWSLVIPYPFTFIGQVFEYVYPILYKKIPIITISNSSKQDLSQIFNKKNIQVVYPGCNTPVIKGFSRKSNILTFVFIARLSKAKGIEDAIAVISLLKKRNIESRLFVIGRGRNEYIEYLKVQIRKLGISDAVIFYGFITEKEKIKVIDKSHFLIAPSIKEGWGLTVHEAGSRGVPTIAYNVFGLREVVKNGENGFLTNKNTPEEIVKSALLAFNDKNLYKKMQEGARSERKRFSWSNSGREFLKIIT